jgi:predicted AAA+ superfamily ATPase
MSSYSPRLIDLRLRNLCATFPAVMINGARAVGKTTTAREYVAEIAQLDIPGTAAAFRADSDAALQRYGRPLLIDEWQEVPEIMGAIKRAVDLDSTPGQFLLTGSNDVSIKDKTWPGTGRIIREKMYGLSQREIHSPGSLKEPGVIEKIIS